MKTVKDAASSVILFICFFLVSIRTCPELTLVIVTVHLLLELRKYSTISILASLRSLERGRLIAVLLWYSIDIQCCDINFSAFRISRSR